MGSLSGHKGDPRLARLRTVVGRAPQRGAARAAVWGAAHAALVEIGRRLDPPTPLPDGQPLTGTTVRAHVEAYLEELAAAVTEGQIADWLRGAVAHLVIVLRRLGDGLYHCSDVPG